MLVDYENGPLCTFLAISAPNRRLEATRATQSIGWMLPYFLCNLEAIAEQDFE